MHTPREDGGAASTAGGTAPDADGRLAAALTECLREAGARRDASAPRIALSAPAYDAADITFAVRTLVNGWPTVGPVVAEVEARLAEYIGVPHAVMVSSGGAANLLMALYLASPHASDAVRLWPGDEVILPAVGWPTTVTPFIAAGCTPVFADSVSDGLNIDVASLPGLVGPRTRAVAVVHCLGAACDLDALTALCRERGVLLLEDCCEAIGTRWRGRHVGTFGALASFSFYFSHHLCAIEGGLLVTQDAGVAAALRSMRANGYPPGLGGRPDNGFGGGGPYAEAGAATFPFTGFNFKPTDFGAALLAGQVSRLEGYVEARNRIADGYRAQLAHLTRWFELPDAADARCRPSPMAFPIVVRPDAGFRRADVCRYLNGRGVDTRPIIGGNIATQPFMRFHAHRSSALRRAAQVQDAGFMIGVHQRLTTADVEHVAAMLSDFVATQPVTTQAPGPRGAR